VQPPTDVQDMGTFLSQRTRDIISSEFRQFFSLEDLYVERCICPRPKARCSSVFPATHHKCSEGGMYVAAAMHEVIGNAIVVFEHLVLRISMSHVLVGCYSQLDILVRAMQRWQC
jgi:hypothetical protein